MRPLYRSCRGERIVKPVRNTLAFATTHLSDEVFDGRKSSFQADGTCAPQWTASIPLPNMAISKDIAG